MLRFNRLRLTGFKSFVDGVDMPIAAGLTGIVGPNGCGKSNVVDSLRWVMGESSAKQMRGADMDDVIFAGTETRPPRNVADVTVEVEVSGPPPPPFNVPPFEGAETFTVTRRIDRGRGSSYRVNGREVRARDVHLLFMDGASGARSAAMVNQGSVATLINAKPGDRRMILDEAAGVGGLYARREEADQKLTATADNLARVEDVLSTLDTQCRNLSKQAAQASRYRELSAGIRGLEAGILAAEWCRDDQAWIAAGAALAQADGVIQATTADAARATATLTSLQAGIPALRASLEDALETCRRLRSEADAVAAERARTITDIETHTRARTQLTGDLEREQGLETEAIAAIARLAEDHRRIEARAASDAEARASAAEQLATVDRTLAAANRELAELTDKAAAADGERAALQREEARLADQRRDLDRRRAEHERTAATAAGEVSRSEAEHTGAAAALAEATTRREAAATAEREATAAAQTATEATAAARARLAETDAVAKQLTAEVTTLERLIAPTAKGRAGIGDTIRVAAGFEKAAAAALGDDLAAPDDPAAPIHWRTLAPLTDRPPLPDGVRPLADVVDGADALARRLSLSGIAEDDAVADGLHAHLLPGQSIVTSDGRLWRWDGLCAAADAAGAAARRLENRNRLAGLVQARTEATAAAEEARQTWSTATAEADGARRLAADAQRAQQAAVAAERKAHDTLLAAERAQSRAAARAAALDDAAAALAADETSLAERMSGMHGRLAALPDTTGMRDDIAKLRARIAEVQAQQVAERTRINGLDKAVSDARNRLAGIGRETERWQTRRGEADRRLADLMARLQTAADALDRLRDQPQALADRHRVLLDALTAAETARTAAAEAVAAAESELATAEREARAAERSLNEAREQRVRAEAALQRAEEIRAATAARIAEATGGDAGALLRAVEGREPVTNIAAAETALKRLKREREVLGPVNLRADVELEGLRTQITDLTAQREDLTEAVAKLRRAIAEIDREGRELLMDAFHQVDGHFRTLFTTLFGGGRAHLALTHEDPLEAGLEIMACPVGKRLQSMSLLSGGEQALTALALRFAVFLTRPTPLCILDEVDAPLDDANVGRFCDLLHQLTLSGTRFLVISHHRLTMARMDRLVGVTMAERGISQLVTVDLGAAEALIAEEMPATALLDAR